MERVQGNLYETQWPLDQEQINEYMNKQMETLYLFCTCWFVYLLLWKLCLFSSGREKNMKEISTCKCHFTAIGMVCRGIHIQMVIYFGKTTSYFLTLLEQDGLISPLKWIIFYLIVTCIHCILIIQKSTCKNNSIKIKCFDWFKSISSYSLQNFLP